MSFQWMRRACLALASVSLLALAACGSSTTESQLKPTRIVSFGDALSDEGNTGARYTVNDANVSQWNQEVALSFGVNLTPTLTGGLAYGVGNARVLLHPDAAGNAATPTVAEQITTFLASNTIAATDLILVNGGISDVIAQVAAVNAGTQTSAQAVDNAGQAGRDLAAQARRLVQAGGTHIVVMGMYDLGKTPWAATSNQVSILSQASARFNEQLLVGMVDLGANVLYVDAALQVNLMGGFPSSYSLSDTANFVCTSVDPGPGIGIGAGQVNSKLCTSATLNNTNYDAFLFADKVYLTPQAGRQLGRYAYGRITSRW